MSLLSVFLGREICGMPDWPGCDHFGQYDAVMNSDDIEAFIDKNAEEFLKEELEILPAGFRAIGVPGDGNCLAHAVSKSCLGIELLYHAMRQDLQRELRENKEWYWKKCIPFFDEESATEFIESAAKEAVPSEDTGGCHGMAEFLGPIHIHAMANVLRRPIVLMSARKVWEQSLAGVYLPERRPPGQWTEESRAAVLSSAAVVTEDLAFESSSLCTPFRAWLEKVSNLDPLDPSTASLDSRTRGSEAVGSLCDELSKVIRECALPAGASELESNAWKVHQAIATVRIRTPIFIAWASAALAHFVCLLPSAPGGVLSTQKIVIPREAMPQRDGQLTVLGELEDGLSREESAKLYLEGGNFAVCGHIWPNRERFLEKVEAFWKKDHPTEDFQEAVLEKGWNILLPNILNNVLDIAQLFKSLNVEDDDDPVWLLIGRTRLLVPRRIEKLAYRLPYLFNVLTQAADRMRPIWITTPNENSVLTQGEEFTIEWGTISKISSMVEKKTGIKLEEQMVEIGWMYAGTGDFKANIARSVPFHTRKHVWKVPDNFQPGRYWLAVRLIPFHDTQMEGAGPPQGSFVVRISKKEEAARPKAIVVDKYDDDEPLWEYRVDGRWTTLPESFPELFTEAYKKKKSEICFRYQKQIFSVDFEQMRMSSGFREYAIRRNGRFEVNQAALNTLKEMGFRESSAKKALESCYNDVEMAVNYMSLDESTDDEPEPIVPEDRAEGQSGGYPAESSVARSANDPEEKRGLDLRSSAAVTSSFTSVTSSFEDTAELPDVIQPMLRRKGDDSLQGDGSDVAVKEIDKPIPRRELSNPNAGSRGSLPTVDEEYLAIVEREAKTWELQGQSLWQKVEEDLDRYLIQEKADEEIKPPSLQRVISDQSSAAIPQHSPALTRNTSAPAVMYGLSRHQWATLFLQARNMYKAGK